jgi:hypothetical protein
MFVVLRRCRGCERETIHRVLQREQLTDDLRARAWQVAGALFHHVSFAICASCQRWTLHAEREFDPGDNARARFDVHLQEGRQ